MNEEAGSKLMADVLLDGYPEGMRAVDQADIRGGGFDIVCVGESPKFWFRGPDERGLYEWLRERRNVHAKNESQQCMRWSDASVEDAADGFILRSSDGAAIVHIREAGAGALLEWLRIKTGGDAEVIPPQGPPVSDIVYGGEVDGRAAMPAMSRLKSFVLDSGVVLQDDGGLGVSFRRPSSNDCICFFNHLGEIELMKYIEYVLVNPAPHEPRKFGELTVRPFEPGGLDVIAYDGRELVHLPEGQLRDIKAWLECKLMPENVSGTTAQAACSPKEEATLEDRAEDRQTMLEREHGGKLMRVRDLPEKYNEVKAWLGGRYSSRNILAVLNDERLRLKWYTRDSKISVVIVLPGQGNSLHGYIGATRECRAPRPGETWTRGNDMADGSYCHETWLRVIADAAFCDVLPLDVFSDVTDITRQGLMTKSEIEKARAETVCRQLGTVLGRLDL